MYVNSDGIYVLGSVDGHIAILMLDHDGNLHWTKLIQKDTSLTPMGIYIDSNIYIVSIIGILPEGKSFLTIYDPTTNRAQGIIMNGSNLHDITVFGKTIYIVGSAVNRGISFYITNFTVSNIDIEV